MHGKFYKSVEPTGEKTEKSASSPKAKSKNTEKCNLEIARLSASVEALNEGVAGQGGQVAELREALKTQREAARKLAEIAETQGRVMARMESSAEAQQNTAERLAVAAARQNTATDLLSAALSGPKGGSTETKRNPPIPSPNPNPNPVAEAASPSDPIVFLKEELSALLTRLTSLSLKVNKKKAILDVLSREGSGKLVFYALASYDSALEGLFEEMNEMDFSECGRSGELFLPLCEAYVGVTAFQTFSIDGVSFGAGGQHLREVLRFPLHALILLCKSEVSLQRISAHRLAEKVVTFMNSSCSQVAIKRSHGEHDVCLVNEEFEKVCKVATTAPKGDAVFSAFTLFRSEVQSIPETPVEMNRPSSSTSSFQGIQGCYGSAAEVTVCVRCGIEGRFVKKGSEEETPYHFCRTGEVHSEADFRSVFDCVPLRFAAQNGLEHIVNGILGEPGCNGLIPIEVFSWVASDEAVRKENVSTGSAESSSFSSHIFSQYNLSTKATATHIDIWQAIPDPRREVLRREEPLLYFMLRSLPLRNRQLRRRSLRQKRPTELNTSISVWPAGTLSSFEKEEDTMSTIAIIRLLLQSCLTFATRAKVRLFYDRCGFFWKKSAGGLSLLLQHAPNLVYLVFTEEAPYMHNTGLSWDELNNFSHGCDDDGSTTAVLLQHRHLWKYSRVGLEVLVHDSGLTLLHWLCLIGDLASLQDFVRSLSLENDGVHQSFNWTGRLIENLSSRTKQLAYTPLHYAAYSDSGECIRYLLRILKMSHEGLSEVHFITNAASFRNAAESMHDHDLLDGDENIETVSSLRKVDIDRIVSGSAPLAVTDRVATLVTEGAVEPYGITPLHVAVMFSLSSSTEVLLEFGADPEKKTILEALDAHDVAVAVSGSLDIQYAMKRLKNGMTTGETALHDAKKKRAREVINKMHQTPQVQAKLSQFASRYACLLAVPQLLFCLLLVVLLVWVTPAQSFLTSNALNQGIFGEQFIKKNVSLANFDQISSVEDVVQWLDIPLYSKLFPERSDLFLEYWTLVGSALAVQIRGESVECSPPHWWYETPEGHKKLSDFCYSDGPEETFSLRNHLSRNTGRYWQLSPTELPEENARLVPNDRSTARTALTEVAQSIDRNTRGLIIWLIGYNPSLDEYVVSTILFEFPLQGSVYSYWEAVQLPGSAVTGSSWKTCYHILILMLLVPGVFLMGVKEAIDIWNAVKAKSLQQAAVISGGGAQKRKGNIVNPLTRCDNKVDRQFLIHEGEGGAPDDLPDITVTTRLRISSGNFEKDSDQNVSFNSQHANGNSTTDIPAGRTLQEPLLNEDASQVSDVDRDPPEKPPKKKTIFNDAQTRADIRQKIRIFIRALGSYFTSDWNLLDFLNFVVGVIAIAMIIIYMIEQGKVHSDLVTHPETSNSGEKIDYFHMPLVAFKEWVLMHNIVFVVFFIISSFKVLKIVKHIPTVGPVISATMKTMGSSTVFTFIGLWLCVALVFMFALHIIFAGSMMELRDIFTSTVTVIRHTVSDFSVMEGYHKDFTLLGPSVWVVFTYICNVLFLNLFIAVISNEYTKQIQNATEMWEWLVLERYTSTFLELCVPGLWGYFRIMHKLSGVKPFAYVARGVRLGISKVTCCHTFLRFARAPWLRHIDILQLLQDKAELNNALDAGQDVNTYHTTKHLADWVWMPAEHIDTTNLRLLGVPRKV